MTNIHSLSLSLAFSLDSLYGRTLKTACPVAASSAIELVVPSHSVNPFVIEPDLARETRNVDGRDVAVWDVAAGETPGRFGSVTAGADVGLIVSQRSKKPLWMFGSAGQTRTSFTHVSQVALSHHVLRAGI